MLDPNPGLILWTIVTFLVVAFLLKKFAWKPLIQSLQQREDGIRQSVERAEQAKGGSRAIARRKSQAACTR